MSVSVVKEYLEVFFDELLKIPLNRLIDSGVDVLTNTKPLSIPPYRMAPIELKEHLKDMLE